MPFTQSLERVKTPLEQRIADKYPSHEPLDRLVIPFEEGDTRLTTRDRENFKNPVFRINQRGVIEVFTGGMAHLRDHTEVERDFKAHRAELDKRYEAEQAEAEADIKRFTVEAAALARQLDEAYDQPDTSALRLGRMDDQLSTVNRQLRNAQNIVTDAKPKISSAMWIALSMNAPVRFRVGEIGREVTRLRERVMEEFGNVLPLKSEAHFDRFISLEVTWRR